MPHYNPTKRKRRRRDTQCCGSISLIKCLLHIFNILFMISGIAILTLACWTIFWKLEYASLLVSIAYEVGTYGLAVAGALSIIGGFLACFGIFFEHRAIILFYTFLLAVVFSLELIIGGFGYYYESQIEDELKRTLNNTFLTSYGFHERRTVAIDGMQQAYKCCGAIRFEDWRSSDWLQSNETDLLRAKDGHLVPDSCCITLKENCGRRDHPSNIPYTGCIYQFTDNLRRDITILSMVSLGICFIPIIVMILSCCLYVKLKEPDD